MLSSLKRKLPALFVVVAVISVIIVSIVTNITILKEFNNYMQGNQEKRNAGVVNTLSRVYKANSGWNDSAIRDISESETFEGMNIKVRDTNGRMVFRLNTINTMMGGHMRMMGMGGNYTEKSLPITVNDNLVGYVDIGYFGTLSLTLTDLAFVDSVNNSILLAAIISVLTALILSLLIAKGLSSPITRLTEVANRIKGGDYKVRYEGNVNNLEIADLSSAINSLAESLHNQDSIRKRMTSDIAHELRTPLTTLKSHMEAIIDGVWEMTPERLGSCYEEVVRLSKLVKNLEQLNRMENDVPDIQKSLFNIGTLVSGLVESFKPQFGEKEILIRDAINNDVEIIADRDQISQVVVNLLSNAFKYTDAGGKVFVEVDRDKKNAYIKIRDTGVGISEQDLSHIFDRFYRGDKSRSRETGGSGIGLTITKALVDAHGGTIRVNSEINKGSEFIVTLPLKTNTM